MRRHSYKIIGKHGRGYAPSYGGRLGANGSGRRKGGKITWGGIKERVKKLYHGAKNLYKNNTHVRNAVDALKDRAIKFGKSKLKEHLGIGDGFRRRRRRRRGGIKMGGAVLPVGGSIVPIGLRS